MLRLNSIKLAGRISTDPQRSFTPNGTTVVNFGLAAEDGFGENKKVIFCQVTAWNKTAERIYEHFYKGKKILIEGKLSYDQWQSKEGDKRSKLYITALTAQALDFEKQNVEGYPPSRELQPSVNHDDIPF